MKKSRLSPLLGPLASPVEGGFVTGLRRLCDRPSTKTPNWSLSAGQVVGDIIQHAWVHEFKSHAKEKKKGKRGRNLRLTAL